MVIRTHRLKWILNFFVGLSVLLLLTEMIYAQAGKGKKDWVSEEEALQVLRKVYAGKPEKSDYVMAAKLFQRARQSFLVPILKEVLKEAARTDSLLDDIFNYIDDRSIIPDIIDIASNEEGKTRLKALRILRKIPDKRALPVVIAKCLHDPYKDYYEDDHGRMYVTSLFINSLMALHTLSSGEIGVEPSRGGVIETVRVFYEDKIEKKREELLDQCRKWWTSNKGKLFKELEKEYGAEEAKRYREAIQKKPEEKEPPAENTGKGTDGDTTPGVEKEEPPPVEKPEPEDKLTPQQTESGNELLIVSVIVLGLVIAVLILFFFHYRKRKV